MANDSAASFRSSNPVLNDVWELCRYSIKATTFCGLYVDGDRERIAYEADAYINQLSHYCCDADYELARYTHDYLIQRPTWPTEWIMHSVMTAWADYLYSGDSRSLSSFYDELKHKIVVGLRRPDHLLSTIEPPTPKSVLDAIHHDAIRDIIDWPHTECDNYNMRWVNTVVCSFHAHACSLMARIATALGHTDDAAHFATLAQQTQNAINTLLVDPATGLYVDGLGSTHSSIHANMFPLAFNLVPPGRINTVADYLCSRGMACSVYGAQFLLEALYNASRADHALNLLASRDERSWTHMLYDVGSTITLEAWDNRFKPNQDWNHAWGAAPANLIPRRLMGILPRDPGFQSIDLRPQLGTLAWAEVVHPTPKGPIHLRVEQSAGKWLMNVHLPDTMRATVTLPQNVDTSTILLNSHPHAPAPLEIGPGWHAISAPLNPPPTPPSPPDSHS